MSDLPKIVLDHLQAAAPGETHPDADVLTAFAEQALSRTEREGVVRHLARCGDCREVVALSIPPSVETASRRTTVANETVRTVSDGPRSWFVWPNLRWVAVAASVVVVGSVLLLNPGKEPPSTHGYENVVSNTQAPGPKLEADTKSAAPAPAPSTRAATGIPSAKADTLTMREKRAGVRTEAPLRGDRTGTATTSLPLAGRQFKDLAELRPGVASDAIASAPAPAAPPASDSREMVAHANETVEVQAEVPVINTESAAVGGLTTSGQVVEPGGSRGTAQAQAEAQSLNGRVFTQLSVVKAKPAAKPEVARSAAKETKKEELQTQATAQNGEADKNPPIGYSSVNGLALQKSQLQRTRDALPQWSLAQGKLQRSLDSGVTWQTAMQLDHPLLSFGVSASGSDVWVGGQAGTLFHTSDNGATWAMVQPSTKAGALAADIVAIEVHSATEVGLTTSNHESWSTADGGKTWDKK